MNLPRKKLKITKLKGGFINPPTLPGQDQSPLLITPKGKWTSCQAVYQQAWKKFCRRVGKSLGAEFVQAYQTEVEFKEVSSQVFRLPFVVVRRLRKVLKK